MNAPAWTGEPGSRLGDHDPDEVARDRRGPERPPPIGVMVEGWCRYCRKELDAGTVCAACAIEKLSRIG